MSLFDIFTFKKDSSKVFTKENFNAVLTVAKEAIIGEIKSNIPGEEKKAVVDAIVLAKMDDLTSEVKNKLLLWLLDRFKEVIPTVTQLIYDFLKEKIENL